MVRLATLLALGASFEPGKAAYQQGRMVEARELLERAVGEAPTEPDPYLYRALVRDELGDDRGARADFERSLTLRPDSAAAHYHFGAFLLDTADVDGAEWQLGEALRLDPSHAWARLRMGDLLRKRGRTDEAAASYESSAKLDPQAGAWHSLGDLRFQQGDRERALTAYERDLVHHPECYEARVNAAAVRAARGDNWGAAEHYGASLRYHPGDSRAAEGLAAVRRSIALRYIGWGAGPALLAGVVIGVLVARRRGRRISS